MKNRPCFRPELLPLEDRCCPALTVSFVSGTLTVSGTPTSQSTDPTTGLLVQRVATGWHVTDGAINYGTYAVTGDIRILLTQFNTDVGVDVNGGSLSGNVLIDVGRGDTSPISGSVNPVAVYDSTATSGTAVNGINGNVTFRNGSGLEVFSIGSPDGFLTSAPVRVGGNVFATGKVGVNSLNGLGNLGDTLFIAPGSVVSGSVYATQIDNVSLLFDPSETFTNSQVGKDVIVNDNGSPTGLFVVIDGDVGGNVVAVGTAAQLAGFSAGDEFIQDDSSTIGGNVTAALGDGLNGYVLFGTINGSVSLIGSGGSTNLADVEGTIIGSAQMTFGNGANVLFFAGFVGGNLSYYGGSGGNDLSGFLGTVNGNVAITVGNGTNVFTFGGIVNGRVDYTGGSGTDAVTINGTNDFTLRVNLGAGADTFTYGAGASVGAATIDFGVDLDTDVYVDNGVVVTWPQTLLNLP